MRGRTAHLFWEKRTVTQVGDSGMQDIELRPLVGLLAGAPDHIVEKLTADAMKKHRALLAAAEQSFQDYKAGAWDSNEAGEAAYLAYLETTIEMHAQMSALTTLLTILGRTPKV